MRRRHATILRPLTNPSQSMWRGLIFELPNALSSALVIPVLAQPYWRKKSANRVLTPSISQYRDGRPHYQQTGLKDEYSCKGRIAHTIAVQLVESDSRPLPGRGGASCQGKSQDRRDRSRWLLRFSCGSLALERQQLACARTIVLPNRIPRHQRGAIGTITWIGRRSASVGTYARQINWRNPQLPRPHLIQRASHQPPFQWKSLRRHQRAVRYQ